MCLILMAYEMKPEYPLIVAANRDEFYRRPTRAAHYWEDAPHLLGGRDLQSRGTWMGISQTGRFAALTNYRDPANVKPDAPSRGELVKGLLVHDRPVAEGLRRIQPEGERYNGFNLIAGDERRFYYYSNRGNDIEPLFPGIYGLSNHLLDTPWPKVERSLFRFREEIRKKAIDVESLFEILGDRTQPPDELLPETGMGLEWERILSPAFIVSQTYGTRSSTVILKKESGRWDFHERTFIPDREGGLAEETRSFVL